MSLIEGCPECDGDLYVTVIDGQRQVETWASKKRDDPENREYIEIVDRHRQPCPVCLPDRHDLYQRGHWDESHEPCSQCMKYRDPRRWKGMMKGHVSRT